MEGKWIGPSEAQWDKMQASINKLNLLVGGVEADGSVPLNAEKSMLHTMFKLTETVFGKDGRLETGLSWRMEDVEKARRDEAQQRKGALWIIGGLSTLFGGAVTALVTWLIHGKKP